MSLDELRKAKSKLAELEEGEYNAKANVKTLERQLKLARSKARRLTRERIALQKHVNNLPKRIRAKENYLKKQDQIYVENNFGTVLELMEMQSKG